MANAKIRELQEKLNRLHKNLAAIEARWLAALQDSAFRISYRETIAECAAELHSLLAFNDSEIQVDDDDSSP